MKKYILYSAFVCSALLSATSCHEDEPTLPEPVPTGIAIAVESISGTSLRTVIIPEEGVSRYFYALGAAGDTAAFADGTLEGIVEVRNNSTTRPLFRDLDPETEYTIYAQAEDAYGRKGTVSTATATTGPAAPVVDIEIVEVAGDRIAALFYPNAYAPSFEYALATDADRAAFEQGTLEGIDRVSDHKGPFERTFEAVPDRSYTLFARAYEPDGEAGEVVVLPLTTPVISWMYIDMKEYNAMYCNFDADWSENCAAVNCWAGPRSQLDAMCKQVGGIEALTAMYRPMPPRSMKVYYQQTNADSTPGNDPYVVLAMFWNEGNVWQGYRIYEFPPYEYDASLPIPDNFSYELLELTPEKIQVRVEFDKAAKSVYSMILTEEQYATLTEQEILDMLFSPQHWGTSSRDYYKEWIHLGRDPESKKFIMAAVGCNANGRLGASKVHYAIFDLTKNQ